MDNKFLSRQKTQALIDEIGVKQSDGKSFLDGLAAKGYTIEGFNDKPVAQEKPSQMSRLGTDLMNRVQNVKDTSAAVLSNPTEPFAKEKIGLRVAGQAAGAVGDVIGAGINAATGGGLDKLGEYIATTETGKQLGAQLLKLQQEQPELAGQLGDLFNIATVGVGGTAAKPVVKAIGTGLREGAEATATGAMKAGKFLKEGISPTPTLGKALEESAVAKTAQEIPAFQKAISAIDTTDVKTFADLNKKFQEAIPTISKQVDDELLKDTNVYRIEDLLIPQVTKAGKEIKTDYITRALSGLDDLYTKLGDDVAKADVQDLMTKAQTQGLTRLEVNNLARQYNSEYGSKAFTATGDIKQGFNAEVYESTRKGLKDIARGGLGGEHAKALDSSLTAIYDAQRLAERNANAVQAMKTRIEEKGWVGKGISKIWNASDLITGGGFRALRDTVLARGSAQKLQNVLELENKLKKNLEVINKAMKAPTEAKAVEILNTLPKEKGMLQTTIDNLKDPKMRQGGYIRIPGAKKELPVSKSSSVNNTTDLLSEAKKYKSAEEFVKAQEEKLYLHGTPNEIKGKLELKSKASGVQVPEKDAVDVIYLAPNTETGKMHTRMYTKQNGVTYAVKVSPDAKIFDYTNPTHRKMIDATMTDTQKKLVKDNLVDGQLSWMATPPVKNVKKLGFDGMKQIERKAGEDAYSATFGDAKYAENAESLMLFNKNAFEQVDIPKIKSQLEDIWKQAQGKSPKK